MSALELNTILKTLYMYYTLFYIWNKVPIKSITEIKILFCFLGTCHPRNSDMWQQPNCLIKATCSEFQEVSVFIRPQLYNIGIKGVWAIIPENIYSQHLQNEYLIDCPLDIASLDIADALPIATSTPMELEALALHRALFFN